MRGFTRNIRLAPALAALLGLATMARLGQGQLPGLRVQVQRAALRSRGSACLALVHHRIDAVPMQDPSQRQPAKAATADRDSHSHSVTVRCIRGYTVR